VNALTAQKRFSEGRLIPSPPIQINLKECNALSSPLIGIIGDTALVKRGEDMVPQTEIHLAYATRIMKAGGIPVILPNVSVVMMDDYLKRCQGILLSGGHDIHPKWYDEQRDAALVKDDDLDERRDLFELPLISAVVNAQMPLLALCRGAQALNVALHGSIHQDIYANVPGSLEHRRNDFRMKPVHDIKVTSDRLASIFKSDVIGVNSRHHQAVNHVGTGITVAATAPDGIVEAIELAGHPFCIGVQWHPEDLQDEPSNRLFDAFIVACRG